MSPRHVAVVPHTHWDREWYESFQTFRLKLVELLDELIPLLEQDPSYARYLLDGQMAVVDDYLEVRPEMENRLRRLAASGRVAMGPWYILVDEFLVTAETIIRDLQLGIEKGAAFGGVTSVGYLPDMFGHIAQMPQILQQAGFHDTVLWRGVPSAVTKSGFTWEAPDGSSVRAEYLLTGYGNGASLPTDADELIARVKGHLREVESFLFDDVLLMNGSDHLMPQPHLGRVLAEANERQSELEFQVRSLAEHIARAPREGLSTWRGELRSGFRSNILMGVLSNRVDVKKAAAVVERHLERRAEPYAALFTPADRYPDALLAIAWKEVIRNAAHDSICACSVDETVDAVLHRFNEAKAIGKGLADRAIETLGTSMREAGVVVANATPRTRGGLVEAVVTDAEFDPSVLQVVDARQNLPESMNLNVAAMNAILSIVQDNRIDDTAWVHEVHLHGDENDVTLDVVVGPREKPGVDLAVQRQSLLSQMGANPNLRVQVNITQPAITRVVGLVRDVPAFGWTRFTPTAPTNPVAVSANALDNGLVRVEVDPTNGTFSLNGIAGYGQLVDEGDLGDSYNYSPPAHDRVISAPTSVQVAPSFSGPLKGSLVITSTYELPEGIDEATQERVGSVDFVVTTTLELRADDNVLRVSTAYTNTARDHRLRVLLPLREAATTSKAECALTVVTRGLEAEGRSEEFGLPTFPSRRFVQAGGLSVVHEGLHEYELVDIRDQKAHTLALTLLRATGMLSRVGAVLRPLPAGPSTPVAGLQMLGTAMEVHYAVCASPINPYEMAEAVLVPLETTNAPGGGTREAHGSALTLTGTEVSAVRRVNGVLEVRVYNPYDTSTTVSVPGLHGWLVDLRGAALSSFDGSFPLRAHGFATFRVSEQ